MGRKKGSRETSLMRVYKDFIDRTNQAAGERGLTVAQFCDRYLVDAVDQLHREYIESEAKKINQG